LAGFDFDVHATGRQKEFLKNLLRHSQNLATRHGLLLKYRWAPEDQYYVTVDGSLIKMQALVPMLITTIRIYAAASTTSLSKIEARRLALRIVDGYLEGLTEIEESVSYFEDAGFIPNSLTFNVGNLTHLNGKMQSFSNTLVLYITGKLGPDQITEECHTILELLLKNALKKKISFESMVSLAITNGILDSNFENNLIKLKDLRRDSKHHGQSISEKDVQGFIWDTVRACHQLLQKIRSNRIEMN
jgi:hypothetical protein